jgi:hypothetical protein
MDSKLIAISLVRKVPLPNSSRSSARICTHHFLAQWIGVVAGGLASLWRSLARISKVMPHKVSKTHIPIDRTTPEGVDHSSIVVFVQVAARGCEQPSSARARR